MDGNLQSLPAETRALIALAPVTVEWSVNMNCWLVHRNTDGKTYWVNRKNVDVDNWRAILAAILAAIVGP